MKPPQSTSPPWNLPLFKAVHPLGAGAVAGQLLIVHFFEWQSQRGCSDVSRHFSKKIKILVCVKKKI